MLVTLLALAACSSTPPQPPALLLISVDTTRADHLGAWGYSRARTPAIDALAASGVRFSRASTVTNNTLPAHVAMLSGLHAQRSGVPRNGYKLGPTVRWAPQELQRAGYDTAAFVSASALSAELGLDRGFDTFDDHFDVKEMDQRQRRGDSTVDAALAWLGESRERPFFLWVHLFDPHYPYTPPAPFDTTYGSGYSGPADGSLEYLLSVWGRGGREKVRTSPADLQRMVDLHDGELAWMDTQIARLVAGVDGLKGDREVMIVLVADHGESLTEHDYLFDHGEYLYQPSLHIPLIVRPPAHWDTSPAVSEAQAQNLDVAPTLLAAAGLAPQDLDGVDLAPALRGGAAELREVALSESCRPWGVEKSVGDRYRNLPKAQSALDWPWKLIVTPYRRQVELYNLESDPQETRDLASAEPEVVDRLAKEIEAWRGGALHIDRPDPENMKQLEALGYVE
ncbi:MAG: sulfatase [Alphaproteobacteria bacterium]|nr:sulfatase [Alphaproteobacteria bacterium]